MPSRKPIVTSLRANIQLWLLSEMLCSLVLSLRIFADPWEAARFPRLRKLRDLFPSLSVGSQAC